VKIARLSIIGLGLIGASIALATRKNLKHCKIYGYDTSGSVLNRAVRRGVIHRAGSSILDCARNADLIVIATPLVAASKLLQQLAPVLTSETVITDVCSTKRSIVALASKTLPGRGRRFVGSHPMFGSELSGIDHADAALLPGNRCILTPTTKTDRDALERVRWFWAALGLRPVAMPAAEHDRVLARASHLPQVLASVLMARQDDASMQASGRGLLDTTRLAGSSPELWSEILIDNAANVARELRATAAELSRLATALDSSNQRSIASMVRSGRVTRERLLELRTLPKR
jgi:prephenate dehydrogenase